MMIRKFVDVEQFEGIVGVVWAELRGNDMFAIHGNEMCGPVNAINVNDTYTTLVPLIELRAHQPHPCIFIRLITNIIEPVHHGAWIV